MTSLNEEGDSPIEIEIPKNRANAAEDIKIKNKTCNERSDSGFSECSNCSEKIPCVCTHHIIDKNLIITEEQQDDEIDGNGTIDIQLADETLQSTDDDQGTTDSTDSTHSSSIPTESTSRNGSVTPEEARQPYTLDRNDIRISVTVTSDTPTKLSLSRSSSVDVATSPIDKGSIMRSDFTNTVNMRKQWLEQSAQKEKPAIGPVTRTLIEGTGKVSMLKQRFSLEKIENGNKKSDSNDSSNTVSKLVRSNQSMTAANNNKSGVVDGLSHSLTDSHSNSTKLNLDERNAYGKSIEPRSPIRLDGRVKEVSTRLIATPTLNNDTIKRNGGARSPNGNNNESFKKAAAFWKG